MTSVYAPKEALPIPSKRLAKARDLCIFGPLSRLRLETLACADLEAQGPLMLHRSREGSAYEACFRKISRRGARQTEQGPLLRVGKRRINK